VYHLGQWGTICNRSFENADAQVACRILGFAGGVPVWAPDGTGKIWMEGAQCVGHETNFKDCNQRGWEKHGCDHEMDVGIECLVEDQHFEWTGCYFLEENITKSLAFGPHAYGHNTATCGVECRLYKFMALHDRGFCSCGNVVHFQSKAADTECGPVCPGELDMGPTRYCGTAIHSAVYQVVPDMNLTVEPPLLENITLLPNVTILNITPEPPPEVVPPDELFYTTPKLFQAGADSKTWFIEPDVSELITGRRYRMCTDLDGNRNSYSRVGDTGLTLYLSPITSVSPLVLQSTNISQRLTLQCGPEGCSRARLRAAYLATECDSSSIDASAASCAANYTIPVVHGSDAAQTHATQAGELALNPDGTVTALLDTQCLPTGEEYRVCLLPQGGGYTRRSEDSGYSVTLIHGPLVAYA